MPLARLAFSLQKRIGRYSELDCGFRLKSGLGKNLSYYDDNTTDSNCSSVVTERTRVRPAMRICARDYDVRRARFILQ